MSDSPLHWDLLEDRDTVVFILTSQPETGHYFLIQRLFTLKQELKNFKGVDTTPLNEVINMIK